MKALKVFSATDVDDDYDDDRRLVKVFDYSPIIGL